ncbi:MAG: dethiobiotin synthase [Sphingomonadaceae bacterium]
MNHIIVTGTGTNVGKTVFAAGLTVTLNATYWKPVQSGLADGTDSDRVRELGVRRALPEAYRLNAPLSPHRAAELDGVAIDPARLVLPDVSGPLIIEGAGGVLVPVTRKLLFADLFARWQAPVVLVAGTGLGVINHALLSIEALRARSVPILGVAFIGTAHADDEEVIAEVGNIRNLGRLPRLNPLNAESLASAFARHFNPEDFR